MTKLNIEIKTSKHLCTKYVFPVKKIAQSIVYVIVHMYKLKSEQLLLGNQTTQNI